MLLKSSKTGRYVNRVISESVATHVWGRDERPRASEARPAKDEYKCERASSQWGNKRLGFGGEECTLREERRRRSEGLVLGPSLRAAATWPLYTWQSSLSGSLFLVIPKARFIYLH